MDSTKFDLSFFDKLVDAITCAIDRESDGFNAHYDLTEKPVYSEDEDTHTVSIYLTDKIRSIDLKRLWESLSSIFDKGVLHFAIMNDSDDLHLWIHGRVEGDLVAIFVSQPVPAHLMGKWPDYGLVSRASPTNEQLKGREEHDQTELPNRQDVI